MAFSKKSLSREVGTRKFLAAFAFNTSGKILSTRCPVKAEMVTTGAHSRNFILVRKLASNAEAVLVSLSGTASHLFTAMITEHP